MSKMISDSFAYQNRVGDEISRRRDNRGFIAGTRTDTRPAGTSAR